MLYMYIGGSAFVLRLGLPEQAMGWLVVEDKPTEFTYACTCLGTIVTNGALKRLLE